MTLKHRRQFTQEFKLQVLAEVAAGKSLAQAARELQLHPTLIGRWQKQHRQFVDRAFTGGRSMRDALAGTRHLLPSLGQSATGRPRYGVA
jgi:transposase-like protein